MKKQQNPQDNASVIHKKKDYIKPVLTILGKVSDLTAGGSSYKIEVNPSGKCKGGNKAPDPRC